MGSGEARSSAFKKRVNFDGRSKACTQCKIQKPLEQFYRSPNGIGGRTSTCKECSKLLQKQKKWGSYSPEFYAKRMNSIKGRITALRADIQRRAKRRELDFDLDRDWFRERLERGLCEVTAIEFVFHGEEGTSRRTNPCSPSVDRIDPRRGYTKDNCRMTLLAFNMLKGEATDAQVKYICEMIAAHAR